MGEWLGEWVSDSVTEWVGRYNPGQNFVAHACRMHCLDHRSVPNSTHPQLHGGLTWTVTSALVALQGSIQRTQGVTATVCMEKMSKKGKCCSAAFPYECADRDITMISLSPVDRKHVL